MLPWCADVRNQATTAGSVSSKRVAPLPRSAGLTRSGRRHDVVHFRIVSLILEWSRSTEVGMTNTYALAVVLAAGGTLIPVSASACETGAVHRVRRAEAVVVAQVLSIQKSDQAIYDPRSRVATVRVVEPLKGVARRETYQKYFIEGWDDEFCGTLSLRVGQRFVMTIEDDGSEPRLAAMSRRYYNKLSSQRRRGRSPPNLN